MELDDLRFNDKDVRRILKIAVKREKDRYSGIDTNYDSAATYQDLMKLTEERGLNHDVVRGIVEDQGYRAQNRFYEFAKENLSSFVVGTIGSFLVGVGVKYLGNGNLMNPLIFGPASTVIIDGLEYATTKKQDLRATVRNDVGTVAGQTLGWTLASLL